MSLILMMNFLHMTLFIVCTFSPSYVKGEASQCLSQREEEEDPLRGHRVVCIYNHKQYDIQGHSASDIDPKPCTHLNYEFATLNRHTHSMQPGNERIDVDLNMYKSALNLKLINPKLKVLLSLGGFDDSTKKYSDLVAVALFVDHFIEEAVKMLKNLGFDGLDVNWQYPNGWQLSFGIQPRDKQNYVEFLSKLRTRFDKENLILSISVSAIKPEMEAAYDGPMLGRYVHYINVMTYDFHGPWEHTTGHHTQMYKIDGDKHPYLNTKAAMDLWSGEMGVDKMKLNVAVATFARTFTLANPAVHGLNAPAGGAGRPGIYSKEPGLLCYYEICQYLKAGNWTEDEHKSVGVYAYSGNQWASYDPPITVLRKVKWVVENGYGGVLIKDMSCDDRKSICYPLHYHLTKMAKMEMIQQLILQSHKGN